MAKLPEAHRAIVDPEKLRDYVLAPEHAHGRHKARVFQSALGIDRDNWVYLREQILAGVVEAEVSEVRSGRYGLRYSVPFLSRVSMGRHTKSSPVGSLRKRTGCRA